MISETGGKFQICFDHKEPGGSISQLAADYHNQVDDRIKAQIKALKILQELGARPELFQSFANEIVLQANSADNILSFDAIGLNLIQRLEHNQEIYNEANRYLPDKVKIPL